MTGRDARLSDRDSAAAARGIGPKREAALRERGIVTLDDALMHIPHRYDDLRRRDRIADLDPGMSVVLEGTLRGVSARGMRGAPWRKTTSAIFSDGVDQLRVVWFNLRGDGRLPAGEPLLICGRVSAGTDGQLEIVHPEVFRLGVAPAPSIRPVYRLPREVPQRAFSGLVAHALERSTPIGAMPSALCDRAGVMRFGDALRYLHQPPADSDISQLEATATPAHQAVALDEMFAFQLSLARERARGRRRNGAILNGTPRLASAMLERVPFQPTTAQLAAIDEIGADLAATHQMNRMLIGDVGSGKTLVALWAAMRAADAGWQTAVMAPTELLAEQHFRTFNRVCAPLGVNGAILTAAVKGKERARLIRAVGRGEISVVFGTHALIQGSLRLDRLGLAVIDEQHRFGVFDRARLIALGSMANVMMMTATPIPRSLALTLFRNVDVSVLDQMPPGRTPITTEIFGDDQMARVDALVCDELARGHRAYYVAPLIEGEDEEAASVATVAKRLASGPLARFRIGTLHSRISAAEKARVMSEFRDGAIQALVSTTVVEVGIDVPEATAIVIIAAERYGLAQLHQLRGRVGRGPVASQCCLVVSSGADARARERLEILAHAASGSEVAHADLRMRGPGDLLGARQSGSLPLRFAGFIQDYHLIERAGDLAEEWLRRDPDLTLPESAGARLALQRMLDWGFSLGDVG